MRLKLGTFASSGAGQFFAGIVNWLIGADEGKLWASEDGSKFEQIDTDVFGTSNINDVFYGADLSTGSFDNVNTGTSWNTVVLSPTAYTTITDVNYVNGIWIARLARGSNSWPRISTDGITWTMISTGISLSALTSDPTDSETNKMSFYNGSHYIIPINYGSLLIASTDLITWTSNHSLSTFAPISVAYGNGLWVGAAGALIRTTTGSTWTTVNSNFGNTSIQSIAYGNGLWVAGGRTGQMRTSTNGSTWNTVTSNFGTSNIYSIAYGNGLWVAGGSAGQIRTSTNGSTWTTVTSNFPPISSQGIRSIDYANGLWIAGGISTILTSTNGSTWNNVTSNFGALIRSIAYGNGLWVAGGTSGLMKTSPQLYTYPNNTLLAAGDSGKLAKSSDGLTWSTLNIGGTNNYQSIAYGNALYYAGGE